MFVSHFFYFSLIYTSCITCIYSAHMMNRFVGGLLPFLFCGWILSTRCIISLSFMCANLKKQELAIWRYLTRLDHCQIDRLGERLLVSFRSGGKKTKKTERTRWRSGRFWHVSFVRSKSKSDWTRSQRSCVREKNYVRSTPLTIN